MNDREQILIRDYLKSRKFNKNKSLWTFHEQLVQGSLTGFFSLPLIPTLKLFIVCVVRLSVVKKNGLQLKTYRMQVGPFHLFNQPRTTDILGCINLSENTVHCYRKKTIYLSDLKYGFGWTDSLFTCFQFSGPKVILKTVIQVPGKIQSVGWK